MAKLRSVSTAFWSDPFIEDLTPSEKLLYIYFITNEKTNMLGIYEVSMKKICFETGLSKDIVQKAFDTLKLSGKIKYENNFIILVNFIKHQNYNPNMKKAAIECYKNLPKELQIKDLDITTLKPLEAFETLSNHLGMVRKVEVEYKDEKEDEVKKENKNTIPTFFDFLAYAKTLDGYHNNLESSIKSKYDAWVVNDWKDGNDNKITNWKTKLINTLPYLLKNNPKRDDRNQTDKLIFY